MTSRGAGQRAKVVSSEVVGGRLLVDALVNGTDLRSRVEVFLGFVTWRPSPGADLLLFEVNGNRSQLIAVPDEPALRIAGLAEGEVGIPGPAGQSIIMRADGSLAVALNGAPVSITGASDATVSGSGTATLDFPAIKLGSGATKAVKLADNSNATKVKAE